MSEENFTAEERAVADAAHDLAALDMAETIAVNRNRASNAVCMRLGYLVRKAERILEANVVALIAAEQGGGR